MEEVVSLTKYTLQRVHIIFYKQFSKLMEVTSRVVIHFLTHLLDVENLQD